MVDLRPINNRAKFLGINLGINRSRIDENLILLVIR